jgi:hypothetical protein
MTRISTPGPASRVSLTSSSGEPGQAATAGPANSTTQPARKAVTVTRRYAGRLRKIMGQSSPIHPGNPPHRRPRALAKSFVHLLWRVVW